MKTASCIKEKRKYIRINNILSLAHCRVINPTEGILPHYAIFPIKDIGEEGISLRSMYKLPQNSLVFLNFDLDKIFTTISVVAKVIWSRKKETDFEIGLQFSNWFKEENKSLLKEFIRVKCSLLEEGIGGCNA